MNPDSDGFLLVFGQNRGRRCPWALTPKSEGSLKGGNQDLDAVVTKYLQKAVRSSGRSSMLTDNATYYFYRISLYLMLRFTYVASGLHLHGLASLPPTGAKCLDSLAGNL